MSVASLGVRRAPVSLSIGRNAGETDETSVRPRALLVDWDGCLAIGNRLQPGAAALLSCWQGRVVIVSNNSTHLPHQIAQILADAGLAIPADRILLAGYETIRIAAESAWCRAMILGDPRLRAAARALGISVAREAPEVVVLLRDTRFTYRQLERAANAILQGAALLVSNADLNHPGPGGVVPETGALLAALLAATGKRSLDYQLVGKPSPRLFMRACALLDIPPGEALMIGDNPDTDVAGAAAVGMPCVTIGGAAGRTLESVAASLRSA